MSHHHAGPVPGEILDRPVPLRSGIGRMHEKVSTSSSAAQAFYDQGLAYLHSYVWIEAVRSFRQALRLDPNLAMSYVEMADAYIGLEDVAAARAACDRARAHQGHMSDGERAWLLLRERELDYLEDSGNPDKYAAGSAGRKRLLCATRARHSPCSSHARPRTHAHGTHR
jgi:tetratricopeptide (TPR) repeat protein